MIVPYNNNLYEIKFVKMHEADAANLVQSPTGDKITHLSFDTTALGIWT